MVKPFNFYKSLITISSHEYLMKPISNIFAKKLTDTFETTKRIFSII